jgi:hypothetical protein
MTGFLEKQGEVVKSWKKRFFVLNGVELSWYESELAASRGESKGAIMCTNMKRAVGGGLRTTTIQSTKGRDSS